MDKKENAIRAPHGAGTGAALRVVRSLSPTLEEDRSLAPDIELVASVIHDGTLQEAVPERREA